MLKTVLTHNASKRALATIEGYTDEECLLVETYAGINGNFKAVTRTGAGTSTLASVEGNDAIVLTDLIVTTDKVNGATVTVQFTDGTNTIAILVAHATDAPCNIAIPFGGHWQGWQGARIDVVTVAAVKTTVSCGYFRIPEDKALAYDAWDARR